MKFWGYPVPLPTSPYIDNTAANTVLDSNRLTLWYCHLNIPIVFLYQEKWKQFLVSPQQMFSDFGMKPSVTLLHHQLKYLVSGAVFLPVKDTLLSILTCYK